MKRIILTLQILCLGTLLMAQVPEPALPQTRPILVAGATIHVGNGEVIENGMLAFASGKITYVGDGQSKDFEGHERIDASGQHVYPGFILPTTQLGLVDINAVRPTRDYQEVGDFKPHVRSLVAYNTDSEIIATLRYNGILLAQSTPTGGRLPGTSSIMMLDGWNWEDAAYEEDDGLHVNWPALSFGARWWLGETERRVNKNYQKQVDELKTFFQDVLGYASDGSKTNLKLAATQPIFDGGKQLYIRASRAEAIVDAIQFFSSIGIEKMVLVGAEDAWRVVDLLKAKDVSILLGDVHERPSRDDEDIDLAYKMPGILTAAGLKVGLTYGNLMSSRNLPFFAGTAVAYGMDKEEALKLITSNTASILGIDEKVGTLEPGKDAMLFISSGDALDMRTNNILAAFIQGKRLNLDGKQQQLYERFKRKYSE